MNRSQGGAASRHCTPYALADRVLPCLLLARLVPGARSPGIFFDS